MTAFWLLAPVMVAAALGVLFVRRAVHAALLLAVVMIGLAVMYAVLEAPFLFAVQIIVYTGAIMMLFLFVLMLVGVDVADAGEESIPGQRVLAVVVGVVFALLLGLLLGQAALGAAVGLSEANAGGNIEGLAAVLFSRYVLAFEATAALLITAALGAMVLAHRERIGPRETQASRARERVKAYGELGAHLGPAPAPGVYARHNAVDTPALAPDGSPIADSVPGMIAPRAAAPGPVSEPAGVIVEGSAEAAPSTDGATDDRHDDRHDERDDGAAGGRTEADGGAS